ncbi:MAG: hypothetical protein ACLQF2_12710 [Rhodomicrobium sp.]
MTGKRSGDFVLAADMAGSGVFIAVGRMRVPSPTFAAAVRDLQNGAADLEMREALIHSLASNAAGFCLLDGKQIETALEACLPARLVSEWRIAFPGLGVLCALYVVRRFQPARNEGELFEIALQLAGKPAFYAVQRGKPGTTH